MKRAAILIVAGLILLLLGTSKLHTEASKNDGARIGSAHYPLKPLFREGYAPRDLTTNWTESLDGSGDPDLPPGMRGVDKETYLALRDEWTMRRRGFEPDLPFDPEARLRAINEMGQQLSQLEAARKVSDGVNPLISATAWTPVGPAPVPQGQTETTINPVSGRIISIAIHPTNPDIVFVGTASGGLFRTLNGQTVNPTWTPLMDTVQTQAGNGAAALGTESIGVITFAPSDPTIVYIGTGEQRTGYFGSGLYRINNATSASPTLTGPINPTAAYDASVAGGTSPAFTYRAISQILVHPTQPGTIFVSTATGQGGISTHNSSSAPAGVPPKGLLGIYRSTNADQAAATVTFTKIKVNGEGNFTTGNTDISDMVLDRSDATANTLIAWSRSGGDATCLTCTGVWRSTNALTGAPTTFTQTLVANDQGVRGELATNLVNINIGAAGSKKPDVIFNTILAATGETPPTLCAADNTNLGRLRRSVDGGVTWPNTDSTSANLGGLVRAMDAFCGTQCFYDIGVALDSTGIIQIGGSGNYAPGCNVLTRRSTNGVAFTNNSTGLHADVHVFAEAPSNQAIVWHGDDGGLWRSTDSGATWTSMNGDATTSTNPTGKISAAQYVSIATHPIDREFMTGGTQDNGTHLKRAFGDTGAWTQIAFGDGGYTAIDQNAPAYASDATPVSIYHTYFNLANPGDPTKAQIQFERVDMTADAKTKNWTNFSCVNGGGGNTAINCADTAVSFYAPMVLGPGNPNTLYFGTDRLYRSSDKGVTMQLVGSAGPIVAGGGVEVTTISVGLSNDAFRIVGMRDGTVWATTTGGTLTNVTPAGAPPGVTVGKVLVDPNVNNAAAVTAYVAYGGFGTVAAPMTHVFKTTNLAGGAGSWVAMSTGLPDIPVNAIVVDRRSAVAPLAGTRIYLGTDIGVYQSINGGTTWTVLNPTNTLPVVPIFDIAFQEQLPLINPLNRILRVGTHGRGIWEIAIPTVPTSATSSISGSIATGDGSALAGVTMRLSGAKTAEAITDSSGAYQFDNVDSGGFYTVTPALANYHFSPASRSFSLIGNMTDAVFTGTPDATVVGNPSDTTEYFVRQQYLDFLGREPDQGGFDYWVGQINQCGSDADCTRQRRIDVSAAFFASEEFQQTGSYIYGLYAGALGRTPGFGEFMPDRAQVIGGAGLAQARVNFANAFVQRAEFMSKYPQTMTRDEFVDALIQTMTARTGVDQTSLRATMLSDYDTGGRSLVVRDAASANTFTQPEYNKSFVLMEYFGYLRRGPDQGGYDFWLNVLNTREQGNYRGMVCAFITSAEYQKRFSPVITYSNADCSNVR